MRFASGCGSVLFPIGLASNRLNLSCSWSAETFNRIAPHILSPSQFRAALRALWCRDVSATGRAGSTGPVKLSRAGTRRNFAGDNSRQSMRPF